jgi:hypothetical protein
MHKAILLIQPKVQKDHLKGKSACSKMRNFKN